MIEKMPKTEFLAKHVMKWSQRNEKGYYGKTEIDKQGKCIFNIFAMTFNPYQDANDAFKLIKQFRENYPDAGLSFVSAFPSDEFDCLIEWDNEIPGRFDTGYSHEDPLICISEAIYQTLQDYLKYKDEDNETTN